MFDCSSITFCLSFAERFVFPCDDYYLTIGQFIFHLVLDILCQLSILIPHDVLGPVDDDQRSHASLNGFLFHQGPPGQKGGLEGQSKFEHGLHGLPIRFFEVEVELISENLAVEDIDSDLIHETCFSCVFVPLKKNIAHSLIIR